MNFLTIWVQEVFSRRERGASPNSKDDERRAVVWRRTLLEAGFVSRVGDERASGSADGRRLLRRNPLAPTSAWIGDHHEKPSLWVLRFATILSFLSTTQQQPHCEHVLLKKVPPGLPLGRRHLKHRRSLTYSLTHSPSSFRFELSTRHFFSSSRVSIRVSTPSSVWQKCDDHLRVVILTDNYRHHPRNYWWLVRF